MDSEEDEPQFEDKQALDVGDDFDIDDDSEEEDEEPGPPARGSGSKQVPEADYASSSKPGEGEKVDN